MKQNRQPILVPSTKFGKKGCSKLLQTHLSFRRQEQDVDSTSVLASSVGVETDANKDEQESNNKQQRLDCTSGSCSYWPASPDAYQLFRPRDSINTSSGSSNNSTDTITISSPQEAVERCITRLQAVYAGEDSWRCEARVEIPTIFAKGLTLRVLAEAYVPLYGLSTCTPKHEQMDLARLLQGSMLATEWPWHATRHIQQDYCWMEHIIP